MQKVESELGGLIDPAFKDHKIKEVRDARMELRGSILLVWSGRDLVGQCHMLFPNLERHIDNLEKIFGVRINNKEWMLREVEFDER